MPSTDILSRPARPVLLSRLIPNLRRPEAAWIGDLPGYRRLLQAAWTKRTCHESFREPAGAGVPKSRGQCGVSSAWLVETLAARQVQDLTYCYGNVYSVRGDESIMLERHCWIEVGRESDRSRLVVDLTGDQAEVLRDHEVLHGPHDKLRKRLDVDYRAHTRLKPSELSNDLVQDRLIILKGNLADNHSVER